MSKDEDKIKHSKRLLKDDNAIKKQIKIASLHLQSVEEIRTLKQMVDSREDLIKKILL